LKKMTLLAVLALCSCATLGSAQGGPGQFDGTYSGTIVPDKNNNPSCFVGEPRPVRIVVASGDLEYHLGGASTIKTKVNADGTFSGAGFNPLPLTLTGVHSRFGQVQNLKGKISGATMEANTQDPSCKYYLSLTKE
jgi:hypothetical protein